MKKSFTLIELIVVVAILGFLLGAGALTLMEFLGKGRDGARITALENISKSIHLKSTQTSVVPLAEDRNNTGLFFSGIIISGASSTGKVYLTTLSGYEKLISTLETLSEKPKDPAGFVFFYVIDDELRNFIVGGFMETKPERYPKILENGILSNKGRIYPFVRGTTNVTKDYFGAPIRSHNVDPLYHTGISFSGVSLSYKSSGQLTGYLIRSNEDIKELQN